MARRSLTPLEALERIRTTICIKGGISGYELAYLEIIETELKTNKKKLDLIGEILVDISKGNYADLNTAIDEIREVLEHE